MTSPGNAKETAELKQSAEALQEQTEHVDASTHKMTASTEKMKDSADRRTELAATDVLQESGPMRPGCARGWPRWPVGSAPRNFWRALFRNG